MHSIWPHTLKLEINNKNSSKKHENNWKMNITLLIDQWVIDEIKEEMAKKHIKNAHHL
jgi:predicted nucleic acid binding AN1-type Zn finger protein